MANELVKVKFYEDTLEAVRDGGRVWIGLLRCCENLGLEFSKQLQKLKVKQWATVSQRDMVAEDGKVRAVTVVDLDTLPGWLFSIEPRRVKAEIRDKLIRYQKEAARVLADHFYARTAEPVNMDAIIAAVVARIRAEMQTPLPGTAPAVPRFTVAERLRFKGWFTASKKQRHTIRRLANALLDSRFQQTPDLIGGTCFYWSHQLLCLDEAIDRVREDAERLEKAGGPSLLTGVKA